MSSGVPLPDSDDEHQVNADAPADGLGIPATLQAEVHAASDGDPEQLSAVESGSGGDSDTASSISGMSGVSSVAPTEVVEDEQDAAGVLLYPFRMRAFISHVC